MNKTTDWWCNYKPLSKRDKEILNVPRPNTAEDSTLKFYSAFKHLLQNIPLGQSLFNHNLYVEKEARTFINYLFDKYSDDETLLITSPMNHPCVVDNMNKFKNILQLHYHTTVLYSNLNQVKQYLINKIYKRAFIYLIGTHQTTGEITPSIFFEQLRDYLLSQNIEPIMVIDDVHGMYIIPRDYSIFDYVITTAHAIIRHFDMGMMFAKNEEKYGLQPANWVNEYDIKMYYILQRKDKILLFSQILYQEFLEYLRLPYIEYISNTAPHIFCFKIKCNPKLIYDEKTEKDYYNKEVELSSRNESDSEFYIRLRAIQYIMFPELFEDAINMTKAILEKVKLVKE